MQTEAINEDGTVSDALYQLEIVHISNVKMEHLHTKVELITKSKC